MRNFTCFRIFQFFCEQTNVINNFWFFIMEQKNTYLSIFLSLMLIFSLSLFFHLSLSISFSLSLSLTLSLFLSLSLSISLSLSSLSLSLCLSLSLSLSDRLFFLSLSYILSLFISRFHFNNKRVCSILLCTYLCCRTELVLTANILSEHNI